MRHSNLLLVSRDRDRLAPLRRLHYLALRFDRTASRVPISYGAVDGSAIRPRVTGPLGHIVTR
jgi:hypothetical protein